MYLPDFRRISVENPNIRGHEWPFFSQTHFPETGKIKNVSLHSESFLTSSQHRFKDSQGQEFLNFSLYPGQSTEIVKATLDWEAEQEPMT